MISEIHRFLESYDVDSSVRAVFLEGSKEGESFSRGTDFKFLINNVLKKHPEKSFQYLRNIYDLAVYIGKYNKPLLVNINGPITGSAASIFTRIPLAMGSKHTKFSLNETHLGYIPDAGASYYLSRLKNDLGTFLALTGYQLDGYDLSRSEIASDRMFLSNKNLEQNFLKCHKAHDQHFTSEQLNGSQSLLDNYAQKIYQGSYIGIINDELKERIINENSIQFRGENKRLAFAEILYRHQMMGRANAGHRQDDILYQKNLLINHLHHYEQNILFEVIIQNLQLSPSGVISSIPLPTIGRCFGANTIEEIFERLKQENSPFTEKIIKILKQKSPLALKITLKLLREAQNSTWKECLEREYRVACRRIQDQELAESFKYYLFENHEESFQGWQVKNFKDITNDQVERYFIPFDEDQQTKKISEYKPDLKPFSMYPVKDYYKKYPDTVRYYLNQDNLRDTYIRQGQMWDVHKFLQGIGINSMNPSIKVEDLREKIYLYEKLEFQKYEQLNRMCQLSGCEFSLNIFYSTRLQAIQEYFQNIPKVNENVQKICEEIFLQYRQQRLDQLKEISRIASIEKKQEFFLKLREKIISERLTENFQQDPSEKYTLDNFPGLKYPTFFPSDNKENKVEGHDPYVKNLLGDLLDKITIEKKHNLVKNFTFDKKQIDKVVNEKQFLKVLIDRIHLNNNDRINYYNVKREEYEIRYGDPRSKSLDDWYDKLIESGYKVNEIKDFLLSSTTEQIKGLLKQTTPDNLRDYVYEFLNDVENRQKEYDALNPDKLKQEFVQDLEIVTKKGFDQLSQLISLPTEEAQKEMKFNKNNPNYVQNLFNKFINYDSSLKEVLQVIIEPQQGNKKLNIIEKTRQEFQKILNTVLVSKIDQIYDQNNVQSHLVTKDGIKTYQFNDPYMNLIDSYILNNLEYDMQEYVSSHTLFVFSALSLQKLEAQFRKLYSAGKKIRQNPDSIQSILREYSIDCQNIQEFQEYTNYLTKLTQTCAILYTAYQDHLIFSEDKVLELQNKIKFLNEKQQGNLSFTNYALMAFEQRELFLNALSQAQSSLLDEQQVLKIDSTVQNITSILDNKTLPKDEKISQLSDVLSLIDDLQEGRQLITGFVIYVERLDRLTQASIQGKDHYLPEKFQINEKSAQIPKFYGTVDIRMNEKDWIYHKVKNFLDHVFKERYYYEKKLNNHDLLMLDYEISKFLMPENIKQTLLEELNRDMEILRVCRDFQIKEKDRNEEDLHEFQKQQEQKIDQIRNPKALDKLEAFRVWYENKYSKEKMNSAEFEQIIKIQKSLIDESSQTPPIGQIQTKQEIQNAYMHILDLEEAKQIEQKKKLTKDQTFFEEYKIAVDSLKQQRQLLEGDQLLDDINLFMKQINS
ncbi:hypothetical protein IMG5_162090 [Ichthyophthirius multifiliis]|uniref:3-hydroxyisobutyryl-CoA hydrolase n=1 Tax=Ichthyophthirius multifiliis TaxID=5932 RepID=G0R055_ICHMU|nr:hypothetical protein IMG5_162090 [Ichthyophthirius multifiliis]EGR29154.1 hypothetical protein IMG5_162090 [Ichthyophthirius multifiliis]|eukprot:XP_004030390.1 hypothetical protein IMG5_162090 [Ichthyophthirius multifiliis]